MSYGFKNQILVSTQDLFELEFLSKAELDNWYGVKWSKYYFRE